MTWPSAPPWTVNALAAADTLKFLAASRREAQWKAALAASGGILKNAPRHRGP